MKQREPSMKQLWAGMAMMALLLDKSYEGDLSKVAADAWRMADMLEDEESRDEEVHLKNFGRRS
jgi:hypothetical protein